MALKTIPKKALLTLLQRTYAGSLRSKRRAFLNQTSSLESIQSAKLKSFLQANAHSRYGEKWGYSGISSIAEYQRLVPIVDYDALSGHVDAIALGAKAELTQADVLMLERTGGSTSTNKYIPYTCALKNEFSEATDVWMADLYASLPALYGTTCYFAISPVGVAPHKTAGGLPIGFEDDAEYFHPLARWAWRRMMSVPATVARHTDMNQWRFETCRFLLADELLGLLSVWSPTFLTGLLHFIEQNFESLLESLPRKRALFLEKARTTAVKESRVLKAKELWPRLALVSCWTDGISRTFAEPLRSFCGNEVVLQPKGLLATEGVVSFPLRTANGARDVNVLAYKSHFLEFLDVDTDHGTDFHCTSKRPLLAHELRRGGLYSPLLTTGNGFARYHLKDVVRCTDVWNGLPCLEFEGKADRISDLCGEKINMRQVEQGLEHARTLTGASWRFALLAPTPPADGSHAQHNRHEGKRHEGKLLGACQPSNSPWHYELFLDSDAETHTLERVARALEEHLETGHHYSYCRQLGQLGPLKWRRVQNGQATFESSLTRLGLRAGTLKPAVLDTRSHWHRVFSSPST